MFRYKALFLILFLSSTCIATCDVQEVLSQIKNVSALDSQCVSTIGGSFENLDGANSLLGEWLTAVTASNAPFKIKSNYFSSLIIMCNVSFLPLDSIKAMIYHKKGLWLANKLEDYDGAIESYKNAVRLRQKQNPIDSINLAGSLSNIGISHFYAGNIEKADKYIREVMEKSWPLNAISSANNLQILGQIYRRKGNLPLAEEYYMQSGSKFVGSTGDSTYFAVFAFKSAGLLHYDYSNYINAIQFYQKALAILHRIEKSNFNINIEILKIRLNLANCYTRLKDYEKAIETYDILLEKYEQLGYSRSYMRTLMNKANAYMEQDDLETAQRMYREVEELLSKKPNANLERLLVDHRSQLLRRMKKFEEALRLRGELLYDCCQIQLTDLNTLVLEPFDTEQLIQLYNLLCDISVIHRDRYREKFDSSDIDTALMLYHQCSRILNQVKLNQLDPNFSLDLGVLNADLLEEVLFLCQDKPDLEKELYNFFEQAKSASLLASIQATDAETHFLKKYPELIKVHEIKTQIIDLEKQLVDETRPTNELTQIREDILKAKEKLLDANKNKMKVLQAESNLIHLYDHEALSTIQQSLDNKTVILSYFLTEKNIYALRISNQDVKLYQEEKPLHFSHDVLQLINFRPDQSESMKTWIDANNRVSEILIGELLKEVPDRIIIIPDGILAYLPFEMLFTEMVSRNTSFRSMPYVIKAKTISYSFSASMWNEMVNKQASGEGLLAMAPEFALDEKVDESIRLATLPLAYAKKEVESINAIWPRIKKFQPTDKDQFIHAAADAGIVHFAGHALLNDDVPENSFLVFSSTGDINDKLFVREIYNMKTPGHLVVLSACNTGQGELKRGEGVMSLARAFTYAGAKSLVYSLWDVNDAATGKIMEVFYRELKKGKHKDEALREAKLNYLNRAVGQTSQPYFWAGFVAMGDMSPLDNGWSVWHWLGLTLFIFALIFFWKKRSS